MYKLTITMLLFILCLSIFEAKPIRFIYGYDTYDDLGRQFVLQLEKRLIQSSFFEELDSSACLEAGVFNFIVLTYDSELKESLQGQRTNYDITILYNSGDYDLYVHDIAYFASKARLVDDVNQVYGFILDSIGEFYLRYPKFKE